MLFAKQKQTLLATVSLFEEGVREMLAVYFLFLNFPLPALKGGKILCLVNLFNITLLLASPAKTSPLAPLRRGEFYVAFCEAKQLFFATVSLFEEGVREMLANFITSTLRIFLSPTLKGGKFWV